MIRRLKHLVTEKRLLRVACIGQLCSPKMVELLAAGGGFDGVWLDQEHAGLTIAQIEDACRAARGVGLDSFVRMAATDYATVMRPLEAGAGGIMAAQVRSADEVEQIVRWAKFHPRGCRGYNATGIDGGYGRASMADYMRQANADSFIAIQIEHADAVADVDRIAAIPDIDLLFIGPADLTSSMRIPGEWEHPSFWNAIERVANAARQHNVCWAILPANRAIAERCRTLGCGMLSLGLDVWAVHRGWNAFRDEYAPFFNP